MASDFHTEIKSFIEAIRAKKWTFSFLFSFLVLLIASFLLISGASQTIASQISQFVNQVEVIAELKETLPESELKRLEEELKKLSMVKDVDYWSKTRIANYVNRALMPGYFEFVKNAEIEIPMNELFRIQLNDLSKKEELETAITDNYGDLLQVFSSDVKSGAESQGLAFIAQLKNSGKLFQALVLLNLFLLFALFAYVIFSILSERSRGFHLKTLLHLSPPFSMAPAFFVSSTTALLVSFCGAVLSFFILGEFLFRFSFFLFIAFVILGLCVIWIARFSMSRWYR